MSQGEGFASGFIIGTVVGGILGGVAGALVARSSFAETEEAEPSKLNSSEAKAGKAKRRQLSEEGRIEASRQSLEDKIAQLNAAIDSVRLSLGNVNGNALETEKVGVEPSEDLLG